MEGCASMRLHNSLRNSIAVMIQMTVTMIISFFSRRIFIQVLGIEYQGLNSLFTSIITILSVAELGIGSAIVYNMYQYIAKQDAETIKSLMNLYKKCYRYTAAIIFVVGLCLLPFISLFAGYHDIYENLYVIFLLFLSDAIFSYLFSYKRAILSAHQENYIVNLFDLLYVVLLNVVQISILLITKNFIYFLGIRIILRLIENIGINFVANKKYPYLKSRDIEMLDKGIVKKIFEQMKGLIFHRIGGIFVVGIDSIIITRFLGIAVMGLYSNYVMVVSAISTILYQIVKSSVASVGNLLTEKNSEKSFNIYKKLSFFSFWIYSFATVSIYLMMEPFITIWLGEEYLLSRYILLTIIGNFYIQGLRSPMNVFKDAAGIFYEDRYIPIVESIINLSLSLVLVNLLGLSGILIATIISTMILFGYSYPKYVYSPLFKKRKIDYFKEQILYLVILLFIFICTVTISGMFQTSGIWMNLFINLLVCLVIPNTLCFIIFRKKAEFVYFKKIFFKIIVLKHTK